MRILVSVGYYNLLLKATDNVGAVLAALDGAVHVEEKGGYGEPRQYIPTEENEVKVKLVPDDSLALPENKDSSMFDKFHKLATEKDELSSENRKLKKELLFTITILIIP